MSQTVIRAKIPGNCRYSAADYIVVEFLSCIYIYLLSTSPRVHEYTESTELSRFELNRNKVKNNLYVRICK